LGLVFVFYLPYLSHLSGCPKTKDFSSQFELKKKFVGSVFKKKIGKFSAEAE
jgi:hypothetical protein